MNGKYNHHNQELKDKLKAHSVRYADLAKVIGCTRETITLWLGRPCDASRIEIIEQAIAQIEEEREKGEGDKYTPLPENRKSQQLRQNIDLRRRLEMLNITHRELADELGCERYTVTYWLRFPLSKERKATFESAIESILQRREQGEPSKPPHSKSGNPAPPRAIRIRRPKQIKTEEPPRPKTEQPHMGKYLSGNQILPWKGRKSNDQRGTGG